jgi:hypothetical protein
MLAKKIVALNRFIRKKHSWSISSFALIRIVSDMGYA